MGVLHHFFPGFLDRLQQSKAAKQANLQQFGLVNPPQQLQQPMTGSGTGGGSLSSFVINPYSTSTATTSTATTSTVNQYITITNSGSGGGYYVATPPHHYELSPDLVDSNTYVYKGGRNLKFLDGFDKLIYLPDGTVIDLKADGSYEIKDKDAKITYRANRIREFNPFMNASDKLEQFIKFCGHEGVRKGEMLKLPLHLFISWLVIESAKADQEQPPEGIKLIPDLRARVSPKCLGCGRFIVWKLADQGSRYCKGSCCDYHLLRLRRLDDSLVQKKRHRNATTNYSHQIHGGGPETQRPFGVQNEARENMG